MLFQVKTGEYEVIDSGVFHVVEDGETVLSIGNTNFALIFEKTSDAKQSVEFKVVDDKNAEIRLLNISGSSGYGTTRPFQIGERDGKKLYLTFVTRSLNDTYLRAFEYSLYTK